MEKLSTIKIGGKTYPLKCDLNVLEKIQEEFGSVTLFERKLLGVELVKDENGVQVYLPDGDAAISLVEPSIKAIKCCLIGMINEGLEIQAYQKKKEFEPLEDIDIITQVDMDFFALAKILHDEYKKCFVTKKG